MPAAHEAASALPKIATSVISVENVREIPVDFPFWGTQADYTLALIPPDTASGEYYLKFCNPAGEIVQKLPCGKLTEPVTFLYDRLMNGDVHLEIFSKNAQTGLLFLKNYDSGFFYTDAIEIPRYTEVRGNAFLSCEEDTESVEKTVYKINPGTHRVEKIRTWKLQKETETVTIWDDLSNQLIYEGQTALDTDGNLINEEYHQYLLWDNLCSIGDYSESSTVSAGSVITEYESREAFLTECGFADETPMYEYYDNCNNLQLEVYLDKVSGKGCGIIHSYRYNYNLEQTDFMRGFKIVDPVEEREWQEINPYAFNAITGTSYIKDTEELEEIIEYTPDGKVDSYKAQGFVGWLRDENEKKKEPKDSIITINYIYRDDGTLFYKEYHHHDRIFETFLQTVRTCYDESGRILYEQGYITHGWYDYYYIYEDETNKPTYCLWLDDDLGAYHAMEMTHFK